MSNIQPPPPPYSGQPAPYPVPVTVQKNGFATAALVLGIVGFVVTGIPLFIGLFLGGPMDILAIVFGILGIRKAAALNGVGKGAAITGLVLGSIAFISIFFGAGTLW